jgi:cell division protein FtsW (lipid II flippase)
MAWHLMFPIFFMGTLAFLLSTFIKNGIGTGVVIIIIGVFFLALIDALQNSKWNIFLNPFNLPDGMSENAWASIVQDNRVILFVGIVLALLGGLTSLQKRERFI